MDAVLGLLAILATVTVLAVLGNLVMDRYEHRRGNGTDVRHRGPTLRPHRTGPARATGVGVAPPAPVDAPPAGTASAPAAGAASAPAAGGQDGASSERVTASAR